MPSLLNKIRCIYNNKRTKHVINTDTLILTKDVDTSFSHANMTWHFSTELQEPWKTLANTEALFKTRLLLYFHFKKNTKQLIHLFYFLLHT